MIYFIRAIASDTVKIGYSADPWRRFAKIQTDSSEEVALVAVIDGDTVAEANLHRVFAAERLRGEWFRWTGAVADFVAAAPTVTKPAGKRDAAKSELIRAIRSLGYSTPYASELINGVRKWPLKVAVALWKSSGHKVGPVADAPDADLHVLAKYAVLEP